MLKKTSFSLSCFLLLTTSCTSSFRPYSSDERSQSASLSELRYEIADVKHTLNNTQVELQILEEQVKKNKTLASSVELDRKIHQIEESQKKMAEDLKQLGKHASQTGSALAEYKLRISELEKTLHAQYSALEEVSSLKSNLASLSQALKKEDELGDLYKVQPGDSLEKIARLHKVSVKEIKEANRLSHDKIRVGQELLIPYSK